MTECGVCRKNNPDSNKFCDGCGAKLGRYSQTRTSRPVGSLNDFEAEVIWAVYCGTSRVQDIAGKLHISYRTLINNIDALENEGLLEKEDRFPHTKGSNYVHLTPDGYNQAAHLAKQRKEEYRPVPRTEPSPTPQPGPQPSGQQVTVTTGDRGSDGWKVCGYVCLILVIFLIILFVVFAYLGVNLFNWIMHLLGLQ